MTLTQKKWDCILAQSQKMKQIAFETLKNKGDEDYSYYGNIHLFEPLENSLADLNKLLIEASEQAGLSIAKELGLKNTARSELQFSNTESINLESLNPLLTDIKETTLAIGQGFASEQNSGEFLSFVHKHNIISLINENNLNYDTLYKLINFGHIEDLNINKIMEILQGLGFC